MRVCVHTKCNITVGDSRDLWRHFRCHVSPKSGESRESFSAPETGKGFNLAADISGGQCLPEDLRSGGGNGPRDGIPAKKLRELHLKLCAAWRGGARGGQHKTCSDGSARSSHRGGSRTGPGRDARRSRPPDGADARGLAEPPAGSIRRCRCPGGKPISGQANDYRKQESLAALPPDNRATWANE